MKGIFQEPRLDWAPAATDSSMDHFPNLNIDFRQNLRRTRGLEHLVQLEDWNIWSRLHHAKLSALRCVDTLTGEEDENINIGAGGFDDGDYDLAKLREVHNAWVSLITTCKNVAFGVI